MDATQPTMTTETESQGTPGTLIQGTKPERKRLSPTLLNFWLDIVLAVMVVFVIWVSVMMQIVFPPPTRAAGWQLWGLSYNQWRDAQFFALCISGLLVLEHVVLHWKWVCGVLTTKVLRLEKRPDEGIQAMYGIATFFTIVAIVFISILAALYTVQRPLP